MSHILLVFLLLIFVPCCYAGSSQEIENLVRIKDIDPAIIIDLRYATDNNFTKKTIYPLAIAIAHRETALKLASADAEFSKLGYHLKIWDAYRPPYVQKIFWDLVPDDRYVANPYKGGSRHNRGGAVDVTLVDKDGKELEMPSGFDDFSSKAWPNNFALSTKVRKNLELLRKIMMAHGFLPLEHEWWHFDDSQWKGFSLIDVPLEMFLDPPTVLSSILMEGSNQALIVESLKANENFKARLMMWQRTGHGWQIVSASMPAVIGRNGFAPEGQKREGDGKSPSGIYRVDQAFGYTNQADTHLPYRLVTDDDIWIDDVHSKEYNHWCSLKGVIDAKSFEHMKRKDNLYKLGAVIEYNSDPVVVGNGSAIFLHIWRGEDKPTAGCVALSQENIFQILKWLDVKQKPMIVMNP